jgi:hypothetical protein
MHRKLRIRLAIIPAAILVAVATCWAQQAPTVRIRGTIERVEDPTYTVKARDGAEVQLTLSDKPQIAGVVKASLSDIKQGTFVGVTAMPQADGTLRAVEVHIFPEAMRGSGEGH